MKTGEILKIVAEEKKIRSAGVSKRLGMPTKNASMLLRRLWKKGLLERVEEEVEDGRNRYVYFLSGKGEKVLKKFGSYEEYAARRSMANFLQFHKDERPIQLVED